VTIKPDTVSVGEPFVSTCWYNPETLGDKDNARKIIRASFEQTAEKKRITFAHIKWDEWEPHDRRLDPDDVPPVPPRDGLTVRILVGEANVLIVHSPLSTPASASGLRHAEFMLQLSDHELGKLRILTREVAAKYGKRLSDAECDAIILERGPDAAERSLSRGISGE
jgi:hypothetical protein